MTSYKNCRYISATKIPNKEYTVVELMPANGGLLVHVNKAVLLILQNVLCHHWQRSLPASWRCPSQLPPTSHHGPRCPAYARSQFYSAPLSHPPLWTECKGYHWLRNTSQWHCPILHHTFEFPIKHLDHSFQHPHPFTPPPSLHSPSQCCTSCSFPLSLALTIHHHSTPDHHLTSPTSQRPNPLFSL